jgi:hypothetical protein
MKTIIIVLALLLACTAFAATTRNDDSCDIAVLPAATLLLPYFEVDLDGPGGETTLATITNVTNTDAIARVTLWTDRGYPVFTFNVSLTGYDVQPLNLYDILGRGVIAGDAGPRGPYSDPNSALDSCELTVALTDAEIARIRAAFTTGTINGECDEVGGVHDNAIGYVTVDVVGNCSSNTPADRAYWTADLRYDNILVGDYEQIDGAHSSAQGAPLVHIRAIPEGGTPRSRRLSDDAGFPRSFYSRYTTLDARQPLPAQFAARWTDGTSLKIWREGRAGIDDSCGDYAADVNLGVADVVVFDEQENGIGIDNRIELASTTKTSISDPLFPRLANGATSGWMYLNLDRSARDAIASQAWVVSSTRAENGSSSDVDAIAFGNGCMPPARAGETIAPANDDDGCDIALLPAATLLLPYFEVDLESPQGETTMFTVTNASPEDRIARVTLWTDYAFPVITFNVYLTGYDVQSINLHDVIARGIVASEQGTGTQITKRGPDSDRNFDLDLSGCAQLQGRLAEGYVERMQTAFTEGVIADLGTEPGCNNVGEVHEHATGYATIDVVRNCSANGPLSEEYWSEDIAWDNVLIGDAHQVHSENDSAQGATLVHIRAIPEGGNAAERLAVKRKWDAGFPRTFYARYQSSSAPKLDGRQPLPSVFAARWIQGGPAQFETYVKIWREGRRGRDGTCATWDDNTLPVGERVRFDENENAVGEMPNVHIPAPINWTGLMPATVRASVADYSMFPAMPNGAISGWMYLNLDHDFVLHGYAPDWASQNWVITSMRSEAGYSVEVEAAALGNGCSAEAQLSETTEGTEIIGPRP